MVIEKENLIVWKGVEMPARYRIGEEQGVLGRGGGAGAVHAEALGLREDRETDASVVATKAPLCT